MSNQTYSVRSVQRTLDNLASTSTVVTLRELQQQLSLGVISEAISKMIKTVSDNYIASTTRESLSNNLDPIAYIQEVIPRIALGRRRGHTSAIVSYIQDNPNDEAIIVVPNQIMLYEYAEQLSLKKTVTGVLHYNQKVSIVTQSWYKRGGKTLSLIDPLVVIDSQIGVEQYLETCPDLGVTRYIIVGN